MPATAIPQDSVFGRINSLIEEIGGTEKKAAETELGLTGQGKKDPGGYQGASTHPSARAASNVEKTPLGSRAAENTKDVKEEHPGGGVDNTDPKSGGSQDDKQYNIGTEQSATGEDPSVEDHYRAGGKDDKRQGNRGGTEGPFNAEEIGEKYSALRFPEITKVAYDKMNNVLADIANGVHVKEAMELAQNGFQLPVPQQKTAAHAAAQQLDPKTAAAAGYELAAQAGQEEELQKQAAIQATVEQTILDAHTNADLVGEYLTKYAAECERLIKQAEPGPMGGGMEGESPMPPPEAAGAGGPPPGPPGGPGDGGGDQGLDEIINALLDMGHTPEEVMAVLQEHMGGGGGGEGGPPPGAGGPPPGAEAMGGGPMPPEMAGKAASVNQDREILFKLAAAASDRFRSGQWKQRPVQAGTKEATDRQELQRYIVEVCNQR